MAKILKMSDRIKMQIGEVTFILAPFTYEQKMEMSDSVKVVSGQDVIDVFKVKTMMLKYGLKKVEGIEDYELSFDSQGNLSDECISEILYLDQSKTMLSACYEIHNGIPDEIETQGVALEILKNKAPDS